MSLLDELKKDSFWKEFLEYKSAGKNMSSRDEQDLRKYIEEAEYLPVLDGIYRGVRFPLPQIKELNKKSSGKKRVVFVFDREENYVLKAISYLLHKYDRLFTDDLYSFRKNIGVKKAIADIINKPHLRSFYSYKVDIHDYFNSVDTDIMLNLLKEALNDDLPLYNFISAILTDPDVRTSTGTESRRKGIMAGVPISGFLANLYLKELDGWFSQQQITYVRYSDDIIVFGETSEAIALYEQKIKCFLAERKLEINPKKEFRSAPGEPWEFLGFRIDGGGVDLSFVSLDKMKDKMRRKAKAILRWKNRRNASDERAISAYIRHFNRKLYDNPNHHEVTWCRWYFPTITTSKSLRILDEYMVSNIRYIATGRHTKANYNLRYDKIKEMGYRNLVNSYYRYKKTGEV